jgi:hypothetical protein
MNEDFVPFELAVKLKEKGYPQHIAEDAYIVDNYGEDEYEIGDRLPIPLIPDYMEDVAAPTIPQVLKWLRKKKGIHIEPIATTTFATKNNTAYFVLIKHKITATSMDSIDLLEKYALFNDACIAGIEYVLDNLI